MLFIKQHLICIILLLSNIFTYSQTNRFKKQALEEFKSEHYHKAIASMERALKESPQDPEIFYYLGLFNHYRAYDSRLLKDYDISYSKKIFEYLDKAIQLKPDFGNARYFYGAECSANAFNAMQAGNPEKVKHYYRKAFKKGAYPPWLLEFGRNMLNSCDKNAILFTGGNADFDICMYLQLHENLRKDIRIIPLGHIDRPWYVLLLKNGLPGVVQKTTIRLSEAQILNLHPFKWETTTVEIALNEEQKKQYNLNKDATLAWEIAPDLQSGRQHAKIESEEIKPRTYLSPQHAMLLQIVEDNMASRPIYFSNLSNPYFFAGLDPYLSNCGLVSRLLPITTEKTDYKWSFHHLKELFKENNLEELSTIKNTDIPRISNLIYNYYYGIINYAVYLKKTKEFTKMEELEKLYQKHMLIDYDKRLENIIGEQLKKLSTPDELL